ncbi:hypothetical protein SSX86_002524 [Deinandra increscens subsp. villosa]|uniref:Dienelactone hydrolase domain-containing protein n=1 Tax=Deinandra increscens subsp. villosa TaxID=3103831 RepID=A0AAP0DTL5_9ASTR
MSGPQCCENPPAISSADVSGEVLQIASLNSYVSGKPDSKTAVLLVSDVFGYGAPKLRQLADKVASAGYYVVVPDFFHGDPLTPETKIEDWLKNHAPEPAVELAKPVLQALKEKGVTKIGAAGFCWGAKVVVELAKDAEIQFAAILHPSFVSLDDIKGVKVPIAILGAEIDQRSPPELIKEFEAALVANEVIFLANVKCTFCLLSETSHLPVHVFFVFLSITFLNNQNLIFDSKKCLRGEAVGKMP